MSVRHRRSAQPVVLPATGAGKDAASQVGLATRLVVLATTCLIVLAVVLALSLIAWVAAELV